MQDDNEMHEQLNENGALKKSKNAVKIKDVDINYIQTKTREVINSFSDAQQKFDELCSNPEEQKDNFMRKGETRLGKIQDSV